MTFPNGAKQTLGVVDAIVTFQDGADLKPTDNLFSRFLALVTCTGRPQTHKTPNHSITKRCYRRRNYPILFEFCNFDEVHFNWNARNAVEINMENE